MALKSETLQMPPIRGGCTNKTIDAKTSDDEDLEDGEIFDDEEESKEKVETEIATPIESSQKNSKSTTSEKQIGKAVKSENEGSVKGNGTDTCSSLGSSSTNLQKNEQDSNWREMQLDVSEDIINMKNKKIKKRKRRKADDDIHGDNEDEGKSSRKKRKNGETDLELVKEELLKAIEDGDDDDEMLFVRGASPHRQLEMMMSRRNSSRHYSDEFPSDCENDEEIGDLDFNEEDFDLDEELEDVDDDERKLGSLRSKMLRLDKGGSRRDRLSIRGKRDRRGHIKGSGPLNRKKRDENEMCIFFMQGKCHKGNDCPFSHQVAQHKKQELCKFYLMDCCNKKDKCLYMHGEFPCKYFHMGLKCYANKNCRFSHEQMSDSMYQVFVNTFGPIRSKGEFASKKGPLIKHGRQETGPDTTRQRDNRSRGESGGGRDKKIPSLFDIKVSIPDEMRKDYNSDSEGGGGGGEGIRTPMPSPPLVPVSGAGCGGNLEASHSPSRLMDLSGPPPSADGAPASTKQRRKDKRTERSRSRSLTARNTADYQDNQRREVPRKREMGAGVGDQLGNDNWNESDRKVTYNNPVDDQDMCGRHLQMDSSTSDSIHNRMESAESNRKQYQYDSDSSDKNDTTSRVPAEQFMLNDSSSAHSNKFPAHLPKKQRQLFLRIQNQQQQRQQLLTNNRHHQQVDKDGIESGEREGTDSASDEPSDRFKPVAEESAKTTTPNATTGAMPEAAENENSNEKRSPKHEDQNKAQPADDQNWYSSDDEDYQPSPKNIGGEPTTASFSLLQSLVRMNTGNCSSQSPTTNSDSSLMPSSYGGGSQPAPVGNISMGPTANDIANVDIDMLQVSELLSKVNEHFQNSEKKSQEKRRDPRLRTDVGPQGRGTDIIVGLASPSAQPPQSPSPPLHSDGPSELCTNSGDMDMRMRDLPFKPAPVHTAATEIDASINSYQPLPYRLIPIFIPKLDYSKGVQPNSKVGTSDPRLRKLARVSEDSSAVSSRDPRHRLVDDANKPKTGAPSTVNSDPRQRLRASGPAPPGGPYQLGGGEEVQLPLMHPPSLAHVQPTFPMIGPDSNMVGRPVIAELPPSPQLATAPISRPTDPRQRGAPASQPMVPGPGLVGRSPAAMLFDVLAAINSRPPPTANDPRTRYSGATSTVLRSDDSSHYGYK